jgi:hypothetical protein
MTMSLGTLLLLILLIMFLTAIPTWPHSRRWSYYPSGGLGVAFLILLALFLAGRL